MGRGGAGADARSRWADKVWGVAQRGRRARSPAASVPAPSPHVLPRSPSLPPSSPARLSSPEIQRESPSYFAPAARPTRWVSYLLSSTIRAPRTGPSTPPAAPALFAHADDSDVSAVSAADVALVAVSPIAVPEARLSVAATEEAMVEKPCDRNQYHPIFGIHAGSK